MAAVAGALAGGLIGGLVAGPGGAIAGAGLGIQVMGGIEQANRARKTARMQADIVLEQAADEEQLLREQGEKIKGQQRALVGASGLGTEGTPLLVMEETARQIEQDALKIRREGESAAELIREEGEAAYWTGLTNTAATLLTGGADLYKSFSNFYGQKKTTTQKKYPWTPTMGYY